MPNMRERLMESSDEQQREEEAKKHLDTSIEELNIKEEQETQKAKEVVIEALGDEINSLIEKFRKEANEEKKEGDRASLIDTKTRVNVIEALMDKEKELGVPEGVFGLVVREAIEKSKNE